MSEQLELEMGFDESVVTNTGECRSPGIHRDVSFEEYASWRAINSGTITQGKVSQKRMKAAYDGLLPNSDTQARKFGRGTHSAILTPSEFSSEFLLSRPCEAILKSGDRTGQICGASSSYRIELTDDTDRWLCGKHAEKGSEPVRDFVSPDGLKCIERIRDALHGHFLMELLRAPGWAEASLVWKWNDLTLKGRVDRYSEKTDRKGSRPFIIDLKTCQSGKGSTDDCQYAIEKYGWHRQAAMYCNGIKALTGTMPEFWWIFVEKTEPFDINAIQAVEDDIEIGWDEVQGVLGGFQNCTAMGVFPGYLPSAAVLEERMQTKRSGGLRPNFIKQARG